MFNKVNVVTAAVLMVLAALVLTVQGAPASNLDGDIKIVAQNQIQDERSYKLEWVEGIVKWSLKSSAN